MKANNQTRKLFNSNFTTTKTLAGKVFQMRVNVGGAESDTSNPLRVKFNFLLTLLNM